MQYFNYSIETEVLGFHNNRITNVPTCRSHVLRTVHVICCF